MIHLKNTYSQCMSRVQTCVVAYNRVSSRTNNSRYVHAQIQSCIQSN